MGSRHCDLPASEAHRPKDSRARCLLADCQPRVTAGGSGSRFPVSAPSSSRDPSTIPPPTPVVLPPTILQPLKIAPVDDAWSPGLEGPKGVPSKSVTEKSRPRSQRNQGPTSAFRGKREVGIGSQVVTFLMSTLPVVTAKASRNRPATGSRCPGRNSRIGSTGGHTPAEKRGSQR